jgi:hypothetical protein
MPAAGRASGAGPVGQGGPAPRVPTPAAPVTAPPAGTDQPATWDDIIRYEAKKQGVSPLLALAVARKESSMRPDAIGDGGDAVGMFQLHEGAATDVGIGPDGRSDPLKNITGGVKYLKQLSDRYNGDVGQILRAYNGGMGNVDKGTVSPEADAYASTIMSQIMRGTASAGAPLPAGQATGRSSGAGPGPTPDLVAASQTPSRGGFVDDLVQSFDPRTRAGRTNYAAMAGDAAGAFIAPGGAGLMAKTARVLLPVLGATVGAGGMAAVENTIETGSPQLGEAATTGALQGGLATAAGRAALWPIRTLWRGVVGTEVANATARTLTEAAENTRQTNRITVDAVRTDAANIVDQVRSRVHATIATVKDATRSAQRILTGEGEQHVAAAQRLSGDKLAATELENATAIADATAAFNDVLAHTRPGNSTVNATVSNVLQGPAKRALDLVGKQVEDAANVDMVVPFTPVTTALRSAVNNAKPPEIFNPADAVPGIGYVMSAVRSAGLKDGAAAATVGSANAMERSSFEKAIASQINMAQAERLPVPQLLQLLNQAPNEISFHTAHAVKRLLDEGVRWDRPARAINEQLTKNIRIVLRRQMSAVGNEPYEQATAKYAALIPLYRDGIGKQIHKLVKTPGGADRLSRMLDDKNPAQADVLRTLLVTQAGQGGDEAAGLEAWNAMRASFVYRKLLDGGAAKFPQKLSALLDKPEFVRNVFGDDTGKQVIANLSRIADGLTRAETEAAARLASTKSITEVGEAEAAAVVSTAKTALADRMRGALATTRAAGAGDIRAARTTGADRVREANRAAGDATRAVRAKATEFKESSLAPFTKRTLDEIGADALRITAGGVKSWWGALALTRLLHAPNGKDILEWAAYSNVNTGKLMAILESPTLPIVTAEFLRSFAAAAMPDDDPQPGPARQPTDSLTP